MSTSINRSSTAMLHYSAGTLTTAIEAELNNWQKYNKTERLWKSDASLWTNADENKWTGWLNISLNTSEVPRIEALANEIKEAGFSDVVLLGMGGSSLCPALMAETFSRVTDYPRLHILDSTDPSQISRLESSIDLKKTFFIVSSKSGGTLEPNIFKQYFYNRVQTVLNKKDVGDRFAAITDPGSKFEGVAQGDKFKAIFYGIPSIGGRYSALSNFGMVPSGFMGINIQEFLQNIEPMQKACDASVTAKDNPGVMLGTILGVCGNNGKDKVTIIASPGVHAFGAWLEQLFAESTGKIGRGLIPVDQEPLGAPDVYGRDRVFIYIRLENASDAQQDQALLALEKAGHVVILITLQDKMHLGAEMFRFEFATAVAGSILGINAFNQPDVEESKVLTLKLADEFEKTGKISQPTAFFSEDGIELFTDNKNKSEITKALKGKDLAAYLKAHLSRVNANDYVNLSAFIEMSDEHTALLQKIRAGIRNNKKSATCLGFGPRFLHSTGQAYKGGPNTGVFFQITADHPQDVQVPGHKYTFGFVITAQAQADFDVLAKRSRRVLRIHLGKDVIGGLKKLSQISGKILEENIEGALKNLA